MTDIKKTFINAFKKSFNEASSACYKRTALYITYCQFYNCDIDNLKKFIKNELKTIKDSCEASSACFRSMLSRELNVTHEFIQDSACALYFKDSPIDKANPVKNIDSLAKYLEKNRINYRNTKKYAESQAKKAESDKKAQEKQSLMCEKESQEKQALLDEAKKAGLSPIGLQCVKLFRSLYTLDEQNKVFCEIEKICKNKLEMARKEMKAKAKKAA